MKIEKIIVAIYWTVILSGLLSFFLFSSCRDNLDNENNSSNTKISDSLVKGRGNKAYQDTATHQQK